MADRPANFDPIARPYRWLEYLTFGPYLERCRNHSLNQLGQHRKALILGDGDGRFTANLLAANPEITVDAVDSSAKMLSLLSERVSRLDQATRERLKTVHSDALTFNQEGAAYDLVITHFFLDCFTEEELPILLAHIVPHLTPGAIWLVSEFAVPKSQPAAVASKLVIATLYRAFQTLTGLNAHTLPDYSTQFRKCGFSLREQAPFLGGLLVAELWSLEQGNHPAPSALTPWKV
jgi:ubiquinone/menaquinone biosynthesis C-methylase UbiE